MQITIQSVELRESGLFFIVQTPMAVLPRQLIVDGVPQFANGRAVTAADWTPDEVQTHAINISAEALLYQMVAQGIEDQRQGLEFILTMHACRLNGLPEPGAPVAEAPAFAPFVEVVFEQAALDALAALGLKSP